MRLLTKAEYGELRLAAGPCGGQNRGGKPSDNEEMLYEGLKAQGRIEPVWCYCSPPSHCVWSATPAGREALKLWPMLLERGLVLP